MSRSSIHVVAMMSDEPCPSKDSELASWSPEKCILLLCILSASTDENRNIEASIAPIQTLPKPFRTILILRSGQASSV